MITRNFRIPRTTIAFAFAVGLAMSGSLPAFADGDPTTATVAGGILDITTPLAADFADRSITGTAQTTTAALATFSVSDLTGTGAGWNVTAQATQFEGGTHDLAVGSLSMSQPTVASPDTDSPDPSVATGPYTIDNGAAIEIASADVDKGMGKYDFSATTLTLSLPADVYAGDYESTVTVSVVSAP